MNKGLILPYDDLLYLSLALCRDNIELSFQFCIVANIFSIAYMKLITIIYLISIWKHCAFFSSELRI